jgi:hypothetical protein
MSIRNGDWLQTYTGRQFWPLDPRPEEIFIEDIAHALAMQCRYAGHTNRFYSVAQHSYIVSKNLPRPLALQGLLHDASEAYLIDVPRPIKGYLTNYLQIEKLVERAIAQAFGLPFELDPLVKEIDSRILVNEQKYFMKPQAAPWHLPDQGVDYFVTDSWAPSTAEHMLLGRFKAIMNGRAVE